MRGAARDRAEYYSRALGAGGSPAWHTQNEVRGLEDLDPLPGGDVLFRPPNTEQGQQPEPPTDAPDTPSPDSEE